MIIWTGTCIRHYKLTKLSPVNICEKKQTKIENKNTSSDTKGERMGIITNITNRHCYKAASRVLLKYVCPGIFLFSLEVQFFLKSRLKRPRKISKLINLNGSEENGITFLNAAPRSTTVPGGRPFRFTHI